MASSEIYRELLVKHRHGLPLWVPDPDENLEEHKKQGISIGDLGILTDDGGFTYLFNIHTHADHSVNKDMEIPASFMPLLPRPRSSRRRFHDKKAWIKQNIKFSAGGSVTAGADLGLGAGIEVELDLTTTDERAAMLYLPHGADREDAVALGLYWEYASKHGESWYKFVNEELKAAAPNNSLYLVTGCDKSGSWALAAGSPQQDSSVQFRIKAPATSGLKVAADLHVSWGNTSGMERRHYPQSMKHHVEVENQCVFVRGLVIAVRQNWVAAALLGKVRVTTIDATTASISAASKNVPFRSTAGQIRASTNVPQSEGPSDLLDQEQDAMDFSDDFEDTSSVTVQNYPEYLKQVLNPGSYICQHLLSSRSDINLVIVHDNNWMAVTSSNADEIFPDNGPDYERLTTHVLERCHLQVIQGTTLLLRRPYQDLATTIEAAIPDLLSALKDNNSDVRAAAALLVDEFSKRGANPELVNLLKDEEPYLGSLQADSATWQTINPYLPDLLVGKKAMSDLHYATAPTTSGSSKNLDLNAFIENIIPDLVVGEGFDVSYPTAGSEGTEISTQYKDSLAHLHMAAGKAIPEFSKQSDRVMAITEDIQYALNLLKDKDSAVRRAAVEVIIQISKQRPDLVIAIGGGIPDILNLLKDKDSTVCIAAIRAITEFSKQFDLIMAVKEGIPHLLNLLNDKHAYVRGTIVSAMTELSKQPGLAMAIKEGIPDIPNLLMDEEAHVRILAVVMIAEFSKHPDFVLAIKESIPQVLNLLKDEDFDVRSTAISAITIFSKQADLLVSLDGTIPELLSLLQSNRYIRDGAVEAISEFAKQPHLIIAIENVMPVLLTYLKQRNPNVRIAAVSVIHALYKQCIISL